MSAGRPATLEQGDDGGSREQAIPRPRVGRLHDSHGGKLAYGPVYTGECAPADTRQGVPDGEGRRSDDPRHKVMNDAIGPDAFGRPPPVVVEFPEPLQTVQIQTGRLRRQRQEHPRPRRHVACPPPPLHGLDVDTLIPVDGLCPACTAR